MYDQFGRPISTQIPEGYKLVRDPNYIPYTKKISEPFSGGISYIPGRFVNSIEDIRPDEVPRDGSLALFPKGDCTEIYAKQVNRNGYIDEVVYVPKRQEPQPVPENPAQNGSLVVDMTPINARLEAVESGLQKLLALWMPQEKADQNIAHASTGTAKPSETIA